MEASQCLRPLLAAAPCDLSSTPPPSHSHLQHSAISFIYLIIVRPPLIALDDDPLSAASLSLSQIFLPPATSHESTAILYAKFTIYGYYISFLQWMVLAFQEMLVK